MCTALCRPRSSPRRASFMKNDAVSGEDSAWRWARASCGKSTGYRTLTASLRGGGGPMDRSGCLMDRSGWSWLGWWWARCAWWALPCGWCTWELPPPPPPTHTHPWIHTRTYVHESIETCKHTHIQIHKDTHKQTRTTYGNTLVHQHTLHTKSEMRDGAHSQTHAQHVQHVYKPYIRAMIFSVKTNCSTISLYNVSFRIVVHSQVQTCDALC